MNVVDAIQDDVDLKLFVRSLERHHPQIYADIWHVGVNGAFRVSEVLNIRFEDVDVVKGRVLINVAKKRKRVEKSVVMNDKMQEVIFRRIKEYGGRNTYLFQSGSSRLDRSQPIGRNAVFVHFKEAARQAGIEVAVGTHSMRKTLGMVLYSRGEDVSLISKVLRHRSIEETMRYLGVTAKRVDEVMLKYSIG